MDKEWIYLGIFILLMFLVLIVSIVNIAPWFINLAKKAKSGEIDTSMFPFRYYREHPEEFSIEHTYSIMKGPLGQNILKKERKSFFPVILGLIGMFLFPQCSEWLEKLIPLGVITLLGVIYMVSMFAIFMISSANVKTKVWVCPYCKKPLMRVQLSSRESYAYQDNPKAIFIRHRWGRRNLLLVADKCPYCKKSFIDSDNDALHDEKESFEKQMNG